MDGQTAVVTGAGSGIGAAVARRFAAAGARVVAGARDTDALAAALDDGEAETVRADVRDEFDVERLMETAARGEGGVDVVVACASVYHGQPGETPLARETYAAFDDTLRTNVRGVFATVREALPHLADDARILVPSDGVAREPAPGYGAYAVSKAAAEALARGFAADLDCAVGVVDAGDLGDDAGEEAADLIRWAATDAPADEVDGTVVDLAAYRAATA